MGTVDAWLIWKLTAGAVHATDVSNASRTMIFNIHDLKYDPVLMEKLDIPEDILPNVNSSSGIFGKTDKNCSGMKYRLPVSQGTSRPLCSDRPLMKKG